MRNIMKSTDKYGGVFIIFVLLLLIPHYTFCDVGSCARHKVHIVFKNNDTLTCYIQLCGYHTKLKYLSEDEILQRMKKRAILDSLTVYRKIQTINYPEANKFWGFKYSAVANEDRVIINVNKILKILKLAVSRCEYGNFEEDDEYLIHFHHKVIEGLSQKDIDLLQKKPYSTVEIKTPGSYDLDVCLNYNKNINEEQLKNLCYLYLQNENDLPHEEFKRLQERHYLETIKKLRTMNIIVVHLFGYC